MSHPAVIRLAIVVRPSSSRAVVGGSHDGALVVRVVEPPDRGRATKAALRLLAIAFDLAGRDVELIQGATSRKKLVELSTTEAQLEHLRMRITALMND